MLESPLTSSEIDSFVALSFRVFLWRRHAVVLESSSFVVPCFCSAKVCHSPSAYGSAGLFRGSSYCRWGISLKSKPFSLCLDSSGNENVRVRSCLSLTRFCGSDCTASLGAFIYDMFLSAGQVAKLRGKTDEQTKQIALTQADCLDTSRLS